MVLSLFLNKTVDNFDLFLDESYCKVCIASNFLNFILSLRLIDSNRSQKSGYNLNCATELSIVFTLRLLLGFSCAQAFWVFLKPGDGLFGHLVCIFILFNDDTLFLSYFRSNSNNLSYFWSNYSLFNRIRKSIVKCLIKLFIYPISDLIIR